MEPMPVRPVKRGKMFDAAILGVEDDTRERQERAADLDLQSGGRLGSGQRPR